MALLFNKHSWIGLFLFFGAGSIHAEFPEPPSVFNADAGVTVTGSGNTPGEWGNDSASDAGSESIADGGVDEPSGPGGELGNPGSIHTTSDSGVTQIEGGDVQINAPDGGVVIVDADGGFATHAVMDSGQPTPENGMDAGASPEEEPPDDNTFVFPENPYATDDELPCAAREEAQAQSCQSTTWFSGLGLLVLLLALRKPRSRRQLCLLGVLCGLPWLVFCEPEEEEPTNLPGDAALDYICSDEKRNLVIEYDVVSGARVTVNTKIKVLEEVIDFVQKPGAVFNEGTDVIEQTETDPAWSLENIRALEDEWRSQYTSEDTAAFYILFVNGHYAEDTDTSHVLGLAYGASSMVVFYESLERECEAIASTLDTNITKSTLCAVTTGMTVIHELGHIAGLVDNGIAMATDHKDHDHGDHCENPDCLMYWANNTDAIVTFVEKRLRGGEDGFEIFDADCLADVQRARYGDESN